MKNRKSDNVTLLDPRGNLRKIDEQEEEEKEEEIIFFFFISSRFLLLAHNYSGIASVVYQSRFNGGARTNC